MPALFTRMVIEPSAASVFSTRLSTSACLVTSAEVENTRPPSSANSCCTLLRAFASRPQMATDAPKRASLVAIARPMPRLPPVTRAIALESRCFACTRLSRNLTLKHQNSSSCKPRFLCETHLSIRGFYQVPGQSKIPRVGRKFRK